MVCEQSVQSLSFFVETRTVWAEYVGKDLCDFKVSLLSTYASKTERTVLDEYVNHRFTLKSDTSFSTYSTHTVSTKSIARRTSSLVFYYLKKMTC